MKLPEHGTLHTTRWRALCCDEARCFQGTAQKAAFWIWGRCVFVEVCLEAETLRFTSPSHGLSPEFQTFNLTFSPEHPTDISSLFIMFTSDFRARSEACFPGLLQSQVTAASDFQDVLLPNLEAFFPSVFLFSPHQNPRKSYWHWISFRIYPETDTLLTPFAAALCFLLFPTGLVFLFFNPCVPISSLFPNLFSINGRSDSFKIKYNQVTPLLKNNLREMVSHLIRIEVKILTMASKAHLSARPHPSPPGLMNPHSPHHHRVPPRPCYLGFSVLVPSAWDVPSQRTSY